MTFIKSGELLLKKMFAGHVADRAKVVVITTCTFPPHSSQVFFIAHITNVNQTCHTRAAQHDQSCKLRYKHSVTFAQRDGKTGMGKYEEKVT